MEPTDPFDPQAFEPPVPPVPPVTPGPSMPPGAPVPQGPGPGAPLPDRLEYLEARVRELEGRVPRTQLLDSRFLPRAFAVLGHYAVAGFLIYVAFFVVALGISGLVSLTPWGSDSIVEEGLGHEGARLDDVSRLPVDASGHGRLRVEPTGEVTVRGSGGSFVVVLESAPSDIDDGTTLDVAYTRSTGVFVDGERRGNMVDAMDDEGYTDTEDPTAASEITLDFHIDGKRVVADRIDVFSDDLWEED